MVLVSAIWFANIFIKDARLQTHSYRSGSNEIWSVNWGTSGIIEKSGYWVISLTPLIILGTLVSGGMHSFTGSISGGRGNSGTSSNWGTLFCDIFCLESIDWSIDGSISGGKISGGSCELVWLSTGLKMTSLSVAEHPVTSILVGGSGRSSSPIMWIVVKFVYGAFARLVCGFLGRGFCGFSVTVVNNESLNGIWGDSG